jgi:hypothetical protein
MQCYEGLKQVHGALEQVRKLRSQLPALLRRAAPGGLAEAINGLARKAAALEGAGGGFRGGGRSGRRSDEPSLNAVNGEMLGLMGLVEGADVTPTTQAVAASELEQRTLAGVLSRWSDLKDKDIKSLNELLAKAGLPAIIY